MRVCLLLLLLVLVQTAGAADGRFYFIAATAPTGSLSSAGQLESAVYLRWDVLDGELPDDIKSFRLERRELQDLTPVVLLDVAADSVKPPGEIAVDYQGAANARRLQETAFALRELALSEERSFSASTFAEELHSILTDPDPNRNFYRTFAARADFNIAQALHRAYLDTPPAGEYQYELIGVSINDEEARLGLAVINTETPSVPLGAAPGTLQQILVTENRCDLPESAKDHYTVALTWGSPGTFPLNLTNSIASQVYLAGYDLYRTVDNLPPATTTPPARDIAVLARSAEFDERGQPVIPGLEKVNRSLITDSGGGPTAPKWLETIADLRRAGLKPGDRRAYYLVSRDFTGNYGPTEAAIVVVPNLVRPATPGPLRPFVDQTSATQFRGVDDRLALIWDEVNLANYLEAYGSTRRFCNQAEAITSGLLEFVSPNQNCDTSPRRGIRLDVQDYLVYRFEDFESAERFKDSDGDGFGDRDEPGSQCNPDLPDQSPENLVYSPDFQMPGVSLQRLTLPSGKQVVTFVDEAPAGNKEQVYWYRVAAKTPDGQLSFLSAPQRALFPDRDLPAPPKVSVTRPAQVPNGCQLVNEGVSDSGPQLTDLLDKSTFTVSCPTGEVIFSAKDSFSASCKGLSAVCDDSQPLTLEYPAGPNVGASGCTIPLDAEFCNDFAFTLEPTYGEGQVPALEGELVGGPVTVTAESLEPDTCVSIVTTIGDDLVRISDSCEEGTQTATAEIPAGLVCGYAVARDSNNNISLAEPVPCLTILQDVEPPAPPQLIDFTVSDTQASFRWRLPPEPLAAILGELSHQGADGTIDKRVLSLSAVPDEEGIPLSKNVAVPGLSGSVDRWCLRMRSLAPNRSGADSQFSEWSPLRCYMRRADSDSAASYLPWPIVPGPSKGADILAEPLLSMGVIPILAIELGEVVGLSRQCQLALENGLTGFPPAYDVDCTDVGRSLANVGLKPALDFLVYRQRKDGDGTLGDWVQVAPLIEYAHWDVLELPDSPFKDPLTGRLNDPYIELWRTDSTNDIWTYYFIDRYPYVPLFPGVSTEYRYQLIYFDDEHRPVLSRMTNWIGGGS